MAKDVSILKLKLSEYKKKYYLNQLLRGTIFFLAIILSMYLLSTTVDFGLKPGTTGRGFIFFTFLLVLIGAFAWFIAKPLSKLLSHKNQISDEEAAIQIGKLFPDLRDKLLNTIQLTKLSNQTNSLVTASIDMRIQEISVFQFATGIKYGTNKKYIKYVAYPSSILFVLLLFIPQFLTESTVRLIRFDQEFSPASYFAINPITTDNIAFKNEDFTIQFNITGTVVPDKIYIRSNNRRIKLSQNNGLIEYTFKKVQDDFNFSIEATDYASKPYLVKVFARPDIKNFNVQLEYPGYTSRQSESFSNSGNLNIPEGTKVNWLINTISSDSVYFSFAPEYKKTPIQYTDNQLFNYQSKFFNNQDYIIDLENEFSSNRDEIKYHIEVIKDKFPSLSLDIHQDTTLYSFLYLGGNIADDYGISKLELVYSIKNDKRGTHNQIRRIPLGNKNKTQNFFYQWMLDSLQLGDEDKLEYFVRVWDNDGINGSKFTQSTLYSLKLPNKKEIGENLDRQAEGAKNKIHETLKETEELKKQIEDIQDKLKSKKNLDWQDKKQLQELLKQKEKLQKDIEELSKQNKSHTEKKDRFFKQSDELKQKMQQLQKLMDDLLDDETKKLYDELKKLLEEQKGIDEVQEMMDKIQNKESNIEKEIERTLELFKKMQFDYKMEDIVNDLTQLEKEQKDLAEDTSEKSNDLEKVGQDQEQLNEDFKDIQKEMEELQKLNEELKNPEDLEDTSEEEQSISEEQEKSSEELNNKQRKKASESQKKAGEKVEGLRKKMEEMQSNMEMVMLEENIENLKDIVDNLVKVSFDQENIMEEFRGVNQSDPRYVVLSQKQLKLRDDSRIIEDSLQSLASRVFQIASFVTRELDAMNDHIEASLQALKDRKLPSAISNQQFSMTSINNLALLLDDVLQQMQQQMSDAMGKPQKGKKGQKQQIPGLSELQQQLNEKIENLKQGGKSGRQLSEELAKLAAQQEMIRQQLQEMEEMLNQDNKGGGNGAKEAIKKMEQTEMDLVNKNITRQTIQRQKDILTRLLQAEDAMRERELDKERESEKAEELNRELPPQFEEYLKAKEKEVELLKTIPLKLNPYYKEEVNKYFKRLSEQ